ncbi:Gfo/Idh/MocA family protein [Paracoccus denitrificans]|jgi:D-galactose 1-dehydrogenase|uniref:Galactose 1-dehydrogenase n=1 Tax=Paracoccus denitrificans (strain Pd 1222) TaxID=318586 RepID=A1B9W5_PARDP|nr:Gfo/Idh/MocA family oxidoreductase [Paracoccus denitrificans]ABL72309.1 galactose 1-dehydrogenase [Paracoccus denitrificans PD1222]MBB4629239.1 D-galactose 1-dehydrogenase [Paracoccus denitrificans]MCU7430259.1 Gfo/Idh/MocA family oxidoreductase [Paracoccus denitrificans]QAR28875.1 Gfo/Idh/MocA family oxidoreductase [Paracoccus denitrificans]UPV97026.1 Gfo/Idh/MocA family oxidoreductase [Paracoccus denitrificans]
MRIALAGIGKIALDQHVPAISSSPDWALAATVSRHGGLEGVENFARIDQMLAARPDISVVSLCLPPVPRFAMAQAALRAGRHVMLEKPPGATLAEVHVLRDLARAQGVSLYATWHSREAQAVAAARAWLAGRVIHEGRITWREDVRVWHPGQDWIFEAGGMGVFDPGINALSILTHILPEPVHVTEAELDFPENRQAPIAARLALSGNIAADFDFRQQGPQTWDMEFVTDAGRLALRLGGNVLEIDGRPAGGAGTIMGEYPALYARMADLVRKGASDVDLAPMVLVADAFTRGRRNLVEKFEF